MFLEISFQSIVHLFMYCIVHHHFLFVFFFFCSSRSGKGIKVWWGENPVSLATKWNPFSSTVPYTIFTSHVLLRRKQSNNPILNFESLPELLSQVIKEFNSESSTGASPDIPFVEEDIVFDYYLGLSAMIHNQSYLGFFKKRGALNW